MRMFDWLKGFFIKRSPREIFERGKNPKFEHVYIKFPGKKLIDVTADSTSYFADLDEKKIRRLLMKYGESYLSAHTHPRFEGGDYFKNFGAKSPLPSAEDLYHFLKTGAARGMLIVQRSVKTKKVEGYLIFRKSKRFKGLRNIGHEEATKYKWLREESYGKSPAELLGAIEDLAKKYGLHYKYLPAEGYEISKNRAWFVKKGLEGKVSGTTAIIGLLGSILFLSSNLTGNVISNLSLKTSNMVGVVLFLVGIAGAFFYFKKRKTKVL